MEHVNEIMTYSDRLLGSKSHPGSPFDVDSGKKRCESRLMLPSTELDPLSRCHRVLDLQNERDGRRVEEQGS